VTAPLAALLLLAVTTEAAGVGAGVEIRFIGNSAFELSDGEATLLIDFPYRSGAFGYMTFDAAELRARPAALCLFTHRHHDHFDASALAEVGCAAVAGPPEVIATAGRAAPPIVGDGAWSFGGAAVRCLRTEHADVEHCSYLIEWYGKRLFFSGDLESLDVLGPELAPLDALFLPAWLPGSARVRESFPAARVVVHHHRAGERLPDCGGCLVPAQGSTLSLFAAPR
jgi:L-ascorbate metabolism protein UlaG (beta-lactamase superfamily)